MFSASARRYQRSSFPAEAKVENDFDSSNLRKLTDEHINENIIRSDEYWYSNVSKKTLRERFFLCSFSRYKLSDSLLRRGTLGRRENIARTLDLISIVYRFPL